jgi:hypothetical protein
MGEITIRQPQVPNLKKGIRMSPSHEPVTDHGDVQFSDLFGHVLLF